MVAKAPNSTGPATSPAAPLRPTAPEVLEDDAVTPAADPVIRTEPVPVRIERDEITNAVSGAIIALGHDAGEVGDLVAIASVDAVMGVLLRKDLADTDEAAPKLGTFRRLTGRFPARTR